jgi:NAD+-dependent protein deacetylase SIR2
VGHEGCFEFCLFIPLRSFISVQPDITFFGEKLTSAFDDALLADRERVDLLLVIGTSLKVAPVSDILCE